MPTKIEWVKNPDGTQGEVWNPTTGCTPVTEGCRNCYAKEFHKRFNKEPFEKIICHPERLNKPHGWKKPRMIFVNSMSDLFHNDVPFEFIERVYDTIFDCSFSDNYLVSAPYHTFVILTKRPERMKEFYSWMRGKGRNTNFPNLWLGVSVSTQEDADNLIPILLKTPAAKHIVSVEPILGEIHLDKYYLKNDLLRWYNGDKLDWVICGGESGSNARPCHPDWVRSLRDQCVENNVPFFFKQWGEWKEYEDSIYQHIWNKSGLTKETVLDNKLLFRVGKHAAGNLLDDQVWEQLPERGFK